MTLLPTSYLAPIAYYSLLHRAPEVAIEQWEHYQKQTLRSRCTICGPGGVQTLTVPVAKAATPSEPICRTRISDHGRWRQLHWGALQAAYGRSPFFEYYEDDFRPFYQPNWEYLVDYNRDLQTLVCQLLDIHPTVRYTPHFQAEPQCQFAYQARPYYQVFAQRLGFVPGLSIVDLLFNMGPEAILCL